MITTLAATSYCKVPKSIKY